MFIIVGPIVNGAAEFTEVLVADYGEAIVCETIEEVSRIIEIEATNNLVSQDTAIYYAIDVESHRLYTFKAEAIPTIVFKTTMLN